MNDGDRFDKFTEQARKVLSLAQEEAQQFQHNYIGTEHLLLGLLREDEGVAARVLNNLGIELNQVRSAIEFIIGPGNRTVQGNIGLTPRANEVIKLAGNEAHRLHHPHIGTEHLLLGLVHEGKGIAAGILETLGANIETVRTQTTLVLSQSSPSHEVSPPDAPHPIVDPTDLPEHREQPAQEQHDSIDKSPNSSADIPQPPLVEKQDSRGTHISVSLIQEFEQVLAWSEPETNPRFYIDLQIAQGNAYAKQLTGDRMANLRRAIDCYQQALFKLKLHFDPEQYTMAQNNLGGAYRALTAGDWIANLWLAIACYEEVLRFDTPESNPIGFAETQSNLGCTYMDLPTGNDNDNLQRAIACFQLALPFFSPEIHPLNYATVQHNLGAAYTRLQTGNQADNLQQAITCYQEALRFRTPVTDAMAYARTQMNLGYAYYELTSGDRAANLTQAINRYREALHFITEETDPLGYALILNNLGGAYYELTTGDPTANLTQAIEYFEASLRFLTPSVDLLKYATTLSNLGLAYQSLPAENRTANLTRAIQYYKKALLVSHLETDPRAYARAQNNLGLAYTEEPTANLVGNLIRAIDCFQEALRVYTPETDPLHYALTQNNLGNAYSRFPIMKRSNKLKAIRAYQEALRFYTLEIDPLEYRRVTRNLANLYFDQGAWHEALQNYHLAMQAGEQLYRVGLSTASKASEVTENTVLYPNAAFAAYHCGKTSEALLILERGKTRLLSEALRLRVQRPPQISDQSWQRFKRAAAHIRAKQTEQSSMAMEEEATNPIQAYEAHIQAVREANDEFNAAVEEIRTHFPTFLSSVDLSTIENQALDTHTALIAFCLTTRGSLGFIVRKRTHPEIQVVNLPNFTRLDVRRLLIERKSEGQIIGGWLEAYTHFREARKQDADASSLAFETWQKTITHTLAVLGERLIRPIVSSLPPDITRIIFQPAAELFLFPLHAAPLTHSPSQLVCDRYQVSYVPSIETLLNVTARVTHPVVPSLYAATNPATGISLDFAESEGRAIAELFAQKQVDNGQAATKGNVISGSREKTYVHFSCHGSYNWDDPTLSGISFTDGVLTLADLQQDTIDLSLARLVTLSACEVGISDVTHGSPEEYVGIPSGFLTAGVSCVVSSLWAVDDLSTTLLMQRFYQNHMQKGMDFTAALSEAQSWIRRTTAGEMDLANKWEQIYHESRETNTHAAIEWLYYRSHPEIQPFSHPYYWAAFTVNGQ